MMVDTKKNPLVQLLPFQHEHLEGAFMLSQEMSWMHRYEDWEVALTVGRGFVLVENGCVIGTALWWPYGEDHATMGMIIVAKAAQGRGLGSCLMDALLDSAKPRTVTLIATSQGLPLYKRRGFVPIGAVYQHQGIPKALPVDGALRPVRPMVAEDMAFVERMDWEATGWQRPALLRRLALVGEAWVLVRDGIPRGFAICRRFGRGHVIGPVVADNMADSQALIQAALAKLGSTFVRVDVPATSQLSAWLEEAGLMQVPGDNITMILGAEVPPPGPARLFALAAQSFN